MFVFFFSSRRRHTRLQGDWSSDVCSSDLREAVGELPPHVRLIRPDDDVDNVDLFRIVDAGVTIRGTVGLELPRLGVPEIGRASCRERGEISVVAGSLKKKKKKNEYRQKAL